MKHKLLLVYSWFIRTLLFFWPDIPIIMKFRGWLYGLGMKKCGKNFQVTHDANIKVLENLEVADNVFIGNNSIMIAPGIITIESDVQIAPHCTIISGNHKFENGMFLKRGGERGNIIIKKGSWVAANCVLGVGAVLPEGCVLGANSFLSKKMSKINSIYGGVPANFIKEI